MKFIALFPLLLWLSTAAYPKNSPFDRNVENTTFLNPACPATLTGVYADSKRNGRVSVHLVNHTEKRVIAVKVSFEGFDAALDKHEFPDTYASALSLRPEREATPIWNVEDAAFAADTASGVRVYLLKLMFADGSFWKDDGTKSCSLSISGRAKPQPNDE
ncbi:MAG TPA: hypothetical protein VN828_15225 [Acidobacteriaceae bacterium]|nr:hypothetical protein [Acidobacteriaceae bacterium]